MITVAIIGNETPTDYTCYDNDTSFGLITCCYDNDTSFGLITYELNCINHEIAKIVYELKYFLYWHIPRKIKIINRYIIKYIPQIIRNNC